MAGISDSYKRRKPGFAATLDGLIHTTQLMARRMQNVLGKSPLAFFQDLRIERAVHLLKTSQASIDQIGAEVGYSEGVTLRTLLRRRLGRSVRDVRRSR
jgi:transcriptional regulator GlxA family with amidase domain